MYGQLLIVKSLTIKITLTVTCFTFDIIAITDLILPLKKKLPHVNTNKIQKKIVDCRKYYCLICWGRKLLGWPSYILRWALSSTDLCENGLIVVRHDGGEVTVKYDCRVVERFLRMFQQDVKLRHAAFKHAPEIARDQCTTDCCTYNTTSELCIKTSCIQKPTQEDGHKGRFPIPINVNDNKKYFKLWPI